MKSVSRAALGLALTLGVVAPFTAAPALAAKEEKPKSNKEENSKQKAKPKVWQLSKEFRAAYGPVEAAVKGNAADAAAKIDAIDALVKTAAKPSADEAYLVGNLRFMLGKNTKDVKLQQAGVVGMLESGSVESADLGILNSAAGQLAYQLGNFEDTKRYLAEAFRLGVRDVNLYLMLADSNFKAKTIGEGLVALRSAIDLEKAAKGAAPADWYSMGANKAYTANLMAESAQWTRDLVAAYPTPQNWRSALIIFLQGNKLDNQSLIDVYRLMHDTKSLTGERDFFDYAALATLIALPGEAKTVIEEGFANGAVSKTSQAVNERLVDANRRIPADKASVVTDEKRAPVAPDGRLAANTGSAYLAYGNNEKAIELFNLALKKGGVDVDTVNTRLGIALARSGQKDAARQALLSVTGPARKEIANFWLLSLNQQP